MRIYSLNLATFIILQSGVFPKIESDEEAKLFYMIFNESEEIADLVQQWKKGNPQVSIKGFCQVYKQLRRKMQSQ
jgi:hypothetical protein